MRLSVCFRERFAQTSRLTAETQDGISDLQFVNTSACRSSTARGARASARRIVPAVVLGVMRTDLDGNRFYDLAGPYGVNLFGYDFSNSAWKPATGAVRDLARCSAPLHTLGRLQRESG